MQQNSVWSFCDTLPGFNERLTTWSTVIHGVAGLFRLNPFALAGDAYMLGSERAGYCSTRDCAITVKHVLTSGALE